MAHSLRSLSADKIVKKVDGFRARLSDIKIVDGFNVRTDDDELREHVAAIAGAVAANLPIPPLEVWVDPDTGIMELVDGHCRYRGYELYGKENPRFDGWVSVMKFEGARAERKARIVTSNSQLKLKPVELGRVYTSLRDDEGMSRQDIAAMVGKSVSHVDQMMLLAGAAPEVISAVESGDISATEAVKLQRDHGDDAAAELERRKEVAKEIGKSKVTARVAKPKAAGRPSYNARSVIDCSAVLIRSLPDDICWDTLRVDKDTTFRVNALLLADLVDAVQSMQADERPLDADKQVDMLEGD